MPRLAVGDVAPDFTLPAADGGTFALADALAHEGRRGVVVYFYPAAMTPGCTTQACDFRDSIASLQGAGYSVVGVSPDDVATLARFAERDHLTFPLASDTDHAVADAYGAWGVRTLYGKEVTGIIRSTVVVGPDGKVTLAQYNVKATGHVARLRKVLGID